MDFHIAVRINSNCIASNILKMLTWSEVLEVLPVTNSESFACLQIHLHESVLHQSPKYHSQGLRLRLLGPAFPDKS